MLQPRHDLAVLVGFLHRDVGHETVGGRAMLVLLAVAFGGASAQLQSALTLAGREHSDIANSFLPVAFNIAIFAAGITGAVLLDHFNGLSLATLMVGLGAVALMLTIYGRRSAFGPPQ